MLIIYAVAVAMDFVIVLSVYNLASSFADAEENTQAFTNNNMSLNLNAFTCILVLFSWKNLESFFSSFILLSFISFTLFLHFLYLFSVQKTVSLNWPIF